MDLQKNLYWRVTVILSLIISANGIMYFIRSEEAAMEFLSLGYLRHIIIPLGVAKILAAICPLESSVWRDWLSLACLGCYSSVVLLQKQS